MADKLNHALITTTAVAATAGIFTTWKLYQDWQTIQAEKDRSLPYHATDVNPEDLAVLARSNNFALKRISEQVLIDRMMMSEVNIEHLLRQCTSECKNNMRKAITVISMISKTREFRLILVENMAFEALSKCISIISNGYQVAKLAENCYLDFEIDKILKFSILTVFDLVSESEENLVRFFKVCKELVAFLLELICDPSDSITKDIRRMAILILQLMMQHENMRCNLISYGVIQRTSLCFLRTLGDVWLSRSCLQILVMQINLFEDYVTEEFLQEMAQLGIIPVLLGCLRSEDSEIIYWSTALVHEFLLKDLHRGVISKIPNLVKTLHQILISSDSSLQRLVLRIYCFLSINDEHFKKKLLNFKPLMKRLSVCLASGNSDLLYWSLLLVHDLAMMGKEAALKMTRLNGDLLKAVMTLTQASSDNSCDIKLVAETFGFFCSCESLHKKAVDGGCIKVILNLLKSESTEIQFWASSLLLNLAMASDDARGRIVKDGGIGLLLEMAVKESEIPQITAQASKILVMLGFTDATLDILIKSGSDSSIQIDGKEHSPMKHGINVVTIDFFDLKIGKGRTFDLGDHIDAVTLLAELKKPRRNEVLILSTQGHVNSYFAEAQSVNIFEALENFGLKTEYLNDESSWCIIVQVDRDNSIRRITSNQGLVNNDLTFSFRLADQVSKFVQEDLLKPILNILMSVPAGSNISKVPELEILSTLARHEDHQIVMLTTVGLLEYLSELIWCFACLEIDQLSSKPLMIAHCVGAMKICHSLSTNVKFRDKMFDGPVLGAIKSFLITNCSVFLLTLKETAGYQERFSACYEINSPTDDVFVECRKYDVSKRENDSEWFKDSAIGGNRSEMRSGLLDDVPAVLSPFCADPKEKGDEIEALISQVTFEKTFSERKEDHTITESIQNPNLKEHEVLKDEYVESLMGATGISEKNKSVYIGSKGTLQEDNVMCSGPESAFNRGALRNNHGCESMQNERSKGSSATKRNGSEIGRGSDTACNCEVGRGNGIERKFEEDENDHFDIDEFEEEDLPVIPGNDDDELGFSQGRGLFDVTRMSSVQRMRSSSAFNPNDWPTTRSGCLSRTLSEANQRAKSPLKDIASDLEDFDDAMINLTNYALMTIYFALEDKTFHDLNQRNDLSKLVHILWCVLLCCKQENRQQLGFIISAILSKLCTIPSRQKSNLSLGKQNCVKLDGQKMTSSMIISCDYLEIYNGNWTFESVCATDFVSKTCDKIFHPLGWYYEVILHSKGIIQIGWTSDCNIFEPEKGYGVGDNIKSVAFDGSRCKIWNGLGTVDGEDLNNSYGRKWSLGDTVSCLLSIDGDVTFWLNGQDLGVGLTGIDTSLKWYPAVSLSLDQHCTVNFGNDFTFEVPKHFASIQDAVNLRSSSSEILVPSTCESQTENKHESPDSFSDEILDKVTTFEETENKLGQMHIPVFSPKDLVISQGNLDVYEVMYYELKFENIREECPFDIGYQSIIGTNKMTCTVKENTICIPKTHTNDSDSKEKKIHFETTVGCGILWPLKAMFFTVDGIGTQHSVDFINSELNGRWTEGLDDIIPFFSKCGLHVNFGERLFLSQFMNSSIYRRNCCQLIYDVILRDEEGS